MGNLLAIALGGAVGAVGRHFVAGQVTQYFGTAFPLGTLTVNVLGSFIMGCLIESMALVWSPGSELRAFLTVGMLGAFTTFSTFSLEVVLLAERGAFFSVLAYIVLSVLLSVGALFLAMQLVRAAVA